MELFGNNPTVEIALTSDLTTTRLADYFRKAPLVVPSAQREVVRWDFGDDKYAVVWRDNSAVHLTKGERDPTGVHLFQWIRNFYQKADIWAPVGYDVTQPFACWLCQHLKAFGRLKAGVTLEQVRAEIDGYDQFNSEKPRGLMSADGLSQRGTSHDSTF
ncbi:MAG: hypothetical protein ACREEM_00215 [Blastocatellia bacterium]